MKCGHLFEVVRTQVVPDVVPDAIPSGSLGRFPGQGVPFDDLQAGVVGVRDALDPWTYELDDVWTSIDHRDVLDLRLA